MRLQDRRQGRHQQAADRVPSFFTTSKSILSLLAYKVFLQPPVQMPNAFSEPRTVLIRSLLRRTIKCRCLSSNRMRWL